MLCMLYIAFVCNFLSIFLFTYNKNHLSKKKHVWYVFFVCCFLYCNLLQLTLVEGLLLPFLYIHTCVIFKKCIQTLKKIACGNK